jgi:hypothetical protein
MALAASNSLAVYQTPQVDGNTVLLQVPWYPSAQDEWCWAACAQMLGYFFSNQLTDQCEFANIGVPNKNCCGSPPDCNTPVALTVVGQLFAELGKPATYWPNPIEFEQIQSEITAGRPVQIGFQWSNQQNHVAVIAGVSQDSVGPMVYVNDPDPQYAYGWVYFCNLQQAYGLGSWQWTWTINP